MKVMVTSYDIALPLAVPWKALFGDLVSGATDQARSETTRVEEELVGRAQRGDQEAFGHLVARYQDVTYGLALRIVGAPEEAQEVTQDAFLRAWRALPRFRGESRFSTWLFRITSRRAFDAARALSRRRQREGPADDAQLAAVPDPSCYRAPGRDRLRLERLIAQLPEMQRAVISLYYLQDCAVAEVAEALQLPPGTVKTHLHRARAALRHGWLRELAREKDDALRGL